jgi:hypothetical protein
VHSAGKHSISSKRLAVCIKIAPPEAVNFSVPLISTEPTPHIAPHLKEVRFPIATKDFKSLRCAKWIRVIVKLHFSMGTAWNS